MEKTKTNKREWVKNVLIVFLVIMLILTFFSNTIMNRSLPEVAAQYVQSGAINAKIRGNGTISANETYDVTLSQTRKVRSVLVRTGDEVQVGDLLLTLEPMESDELKQAQDALEDMELNYQKSLIEAANSASTENRDIQKKQQDYNDAVALYNQYSTMDPSRIAREKADAERRLTELERAQKDAQDAYNDRATEKSELQTELTELETRVTELRAILDKKSALDDAYQVLVEDEHRYKKDYDRVLELAGQDVNVAMSYARYPESMAHLLKESDLNNSQPYYDPLSDGDSAPVGSPQLIRANELAVAYLTIAEDNEKINTISLELDRLIEDTTDVYSVAGAEDEYNTIFVECEQLRSELENFDHITELVKADLDAATRNVEDQNAYISQLSKAETAAEQVKSTKQILEDALFEQGLGDAANLDAQAARDAIEAQKALIEELSAEADGQEIQSTVNGVVSTIHVTAGNTAGAETPVVTITVADRGYTLQIPVTMEQARQVTIGDTADISNYWNGDITATLENIINDPKNPTQGKLLMFRLTGEGVEPGANLTLSIGQRSANYDALIPNSAVRTDSNGDFVLVIVAKSSPLGNRYVATRADVKVLAKDDTTSAVSGLVNGDYVITTTTDFIEAGDQVRLVDNG